jgi:L-fuconolactonase
MSAAAAAPNVYGQVSGLNTAADWETWTSADLVESIGHSIEAFGPDRLLFGSDRPVANLAGDYDKVWTETGRALDALGVSAEDRAAILGGIATALYSIDA